MFKMAYPVEAPDNDAPLMAMRGPFEKNIAILSDMGYQAIELLIRDPVALRGTGWEEVLARYNMQVAAISTAPMDKADHITLQSGNTEEAMRRIAEMIEIAASWHCPISIGKARGMCQGKSLEPLRTRLQRLHDLAAGKDVLLAIEPQSKSNIDNLNTIAETDAFISPIGPYIGLHLDTFHMDIEESNPANAIRTAHSKICFVHMADHERKIPGTAGMDITSVLEALNEIGYMGFLSPEIRQNPDSFTVAELCMEWTPSLFFQKSKSHNTY